MMMTSISDRIEPAVVDPSMTQSVDDGQLGNAATAAGTNVSPTTPVQRSKPRPLKLASNNTPAVTSFVQSSSNNPPQQSMTVEELLDLIQQINNAVKAGQFNAQLANQIFRLCQQLKISGECMEQSHRNDLNRVFVSLRQACCRDNGHLGTPCRLKIMELVELRAMGWRPSLAHSQYYLNRTTGSPQEYHPNMNGQHMQQQPQQPLQSQQYPPMQSTPIAPVRAQLPSHPQQQQQQQQQPQQQPAYPPRPSQPDSADQAMVAGATPVSAPPFGAIPINPFGAFAPAAPPHMFGMTNIDLTASHPGPQMMPAVSQQSMAPTSYYLIPAPGAWPQTVIAAGPGMLPPPASPIGGPPPPQAFAGPPPGHTLIAAQPQQPVAASEPETSWPRGAVTKASKFSKPQKVPGKAQYRDEIIIRNADSGKIMGVKGRRVAVVEELSKTIISFQKVAQGAKERALTITGNSEETIEFAKKLIDETIRRNVSPNRPEGASEDFATRPDPRDEDEDVPEDDEGDEGEADLGIQIETGEDGTLKLSCADPAVLQAAQAALSQYLNKAGQQRKVLTPEEKELRKERRKSMPIRAQSTTDSKEVSSQGISRNRELQRRGSISNGTNSGGVGASDSSAPMGSDSPNWRALAKSTPNLAAALEPKKETPRTTAVYSRETLLRCAQSPLVVEATPGKIAAIAKDAADIMRPNGGKLGDYERQRAAAAQS